MPAKEKSFNFSDPGMSAVVCLRRPMSERDLFFHLLLPGLVDGLTAGR